GPAGHRHRRRGRRPHPPHPPGPARRSRGHRRIRRGPARRRHRADLERNRAAAVGRGAWRCRGLIAAGRTGAAPARRTRRHDLRLSPGRHLAAARRRRGQLRRRAADLRTPTATQLAALSYLAVAVTAVVFLAWYAAMTRLGVDRTGLFNG